MKKQVNSEDDRARLRQRRTSSGKKKAAGAIIGAAILMSILFSAITIYFLTIQTGQATRSQADVEAVDYYNEKLTADFEIISADELVDKDPNGDGTVEIDMSNRGPISINAVLLIVYNKTTSQILYQKDLRVGSPNGVGITVNGGDAMQTTTYCSADPLGNPKLCDHLLSYRIDIITERGIIASTTWPPPPSPRLGFSLQEVFEFASASTIASGLGAIQLDFKSFGVIFPDFQARDGVDQTGWKVKTDKATGYPAFRIPEDQRTFLTIRVRNVDPSSENMTLLHDTGLVVNLASDQNAQQDAAVFLCNSTQTDPAVSVGAYDESIVNRTIILQNAHGANVSLTERWYNLIFCDTDAIRGTGNYDPNWAADLPNNAIPINPTFLVARGEFVESHRQYGQTIPFQGVTITSGTFHACLKYVNQTYGDCSPDQYDKYRASNSTIINSGTVVNLKPIGGTGPYTVTWVYPDGSYRVLEEWVNVNGYGNIPINIPTTNQTGGSIQPGFYIVQVLDWNYNVYSMTFYVKADNNFPTAQDFSRSTNEDIPLLIDIPSLVPPDPDGDPLFVEITAPPMNGTAIVNPDGSITYTPFLNYFGTDTIGYKIDDKDGGTATATISITIISVNDAPVALNGNVPTFNEDESRTFFLSATDVEGNALTFEITSTSNATRGTANLDNPSTGQVTYTPNQAADGDVTLFFRADDSQSVNNLSNIASVTISINDRPVANSQTGLLVNENSALLVVLTGTDPDGDPINYSTLNPANGTLSGTVPNLTYSPAAGFYGSDSFQFQVTDPMGLSSTFATISITVNGIPRANDDTANTGEDTPVVVSVLANDNDPDLDPVTITSVSSVLGWTTTINANGTITFNPKANFAGSEFFTYTVSDGRGGIASAQVTINVSPIQDAPEADSQSGIRTRINEDIAITLTGSDVDGDPITYIIVDQPLNGTLLGTAPTLTYRPDTNYAGPDSFTFKVNDGISDSNIATISITVNTPPIANAQSVTATEDTPKTITLTGSDVDGDSLTFVVVTSPLGTIGGGSGATRTYTPPANYNDQDSFTFRVSDGLDNSAEATVTITVDPVNDDPIANDDSGSVAEDSPSGITIAVVDNDSDIEGDPLTVTAVGSESPGGSGTTSIVGGGSSINFVPSADFEGPVTFTYTISDGNGGSDSATVTITVIAENDPPVANNDSYPDAKKNTVHVLHVRANDNDVDLSDTLTIQSVTQPLNCVSTCVTIINGGADLQFSAPNSIDTYTFQYTVRDSSGFTSTATVTVIVVNGGQTYT